MNFYVYILASARNGTLYIGVTRDLIKRVYQHKYEAGPSFTKKYTVNQLVHFEVFDDAINAITREKQLKNWRRRRKLELIGKTNAYWIDLYPTLT